MKLSISLVAIKKITSTVARSSFSENELDRAARLILDIEGMINPPILRRTSLESFEIVNGDFEYYASVRAKEIDPPKGEFIGAFIIDSDNEEALRKQIEILRKAKVFSNQPPQTSEPISKPILPTPQLQAQPDSVNFISQMRSLFQQLEDSLQVKFEHSLQTKFELLSSRIDRLNEHLKQPQIAEKQAPVATSTKTTAVRGDYRRMTVKELKAIADQRGIKVPSKSKKDQIIALLEKSNVS